MSGHVSSKSICFALACAALLAADAEAQPTSGECRVTFSMENRSRHVWGDVTAECTYSCAWYMHSHLWGNWGVESVWGRRNDGHQFRGWKDTEYTLPCAENLSAKPQWNSCTTDPDRTRGDSYWFNHNTNTEQFSGSETIHAHNMVISQNSCPDDFGGGCFPGEGNVTTNDFIETWELDPNDWDERVMRIDYPSMTAWYYCEDAVTCWPTEPSPWTPSFGGTYMNAEARIRVTGVEWVDWGCCSNGLWICI